MTRRAKIEPGDIADPEESIIDLSSTQEDIVIENATVDNPLEQERLRWLAFMEEQVEIMIGESDDPNAENPVTCGVNGDTKRLMRGTPHKLKRKFLDSLIRTKTRITTETYKDAKGLDQTRMVNKPVAAYPISILDHGPNPQLSQRWYEFRRREAF